MKDAHVIHLFVSASMFYCLMQTKMSIKNSICKNEDKNLVIAMDDASSRKKKLVFNIEKYISNDATIKEFMNMCEGKF